jgi:hypothetical protein
MGLSVLERLKRERPPGRVERRLKPAEPVHDLVIEI